jgi:hypothetical protein
MYDPDTKKTYRCKRKEWHHLTNLTKDTKWRNNRIKYYDMLNGLNGISFKRSNHLIYLANLRAIAPKLKNLLKFYGANCYKKRKFTRFKKTQQAFAKIIARMDLGKETNQLTYIGFGSASVNNNGACKGAKVPCTGLYKRLGNHPRIRRGYANEHYTTKRCSKCHHDTKKVNGWIEKKSENGEKKLVWGSIHELRRCSNNECCTLWNRDRNASINIRQVAIALMKKTPHPKYLTKKWKPVVV